MRDPLGFIESVEWTFASSMPWIPHWYIVKWKLEDRSLFDELARHIHLEGRLGRWGAEYVNWYLHLPDHPFYYWTMHGLLPEIFIINRAKVEREDVRYLVDGDLSQRDRELIEGWDWAECPNCLSRVPITQEWGTEDLLGIYGTQLISLRCRSCGHRYV